MAFSNTVLRAGIDPQSGRAFEEGTWLATAVTTGTITPGAGTGFPANTPKITKITDYVVTNDTSTNTIASSLGGYFTSLVIDAVTSGDAGKYRIEGKAA